MGREKEMKPKGRSKKNTYKKEKNIHPLKTNQNIGGGGFYICFIIGIMRDINPNYIYIKSLRVRKEKRKHKAE
jgi:hypothetical protein